MSKKTVTTTAEAEKVVKDIRRATRKIYSAEDRICIVLAGLSGEECIAELCRRVNRPGFTGGQNSRRIAHHGADTQQEDLEAVFT